MSAGLPSTRLAPRAFALRRRSPRGPASKQVAFAALYGEHHQALYRYCRSIVRHEEDARDALQSSFAKAYAALQEDSPDIDLRPWLFRIAHNESISVIRRRRPTDDLETATDVGHDPMPRELEVREELRLLQSDLADLAERHRSALVLRELCGLSHDEIAVVLETTRAAVKQVVYEARTALHDCREGRAMPCDDVRRALSDGDGRKLRARRHRAHLRACPGCRSFEAVLRERPVQLAALSPLLPATASLAILSEIAPAAKAMAAAAAGTGGASAGAAGAGGLGALLGGGKAAVVAVALATTAAGGTVAATSIEHEPTSVSGTTQPAQPAQPARTADEAAPARPRTGALAGRTRGERVSTRAANPRRSAVRASDADGPRSRAGGPPADRDADAALVPASVVPGARVAPGASRSRPSDPRPGGNGHAGRPGATTRHSAPAEPPTRAPTPAAPTRSAPVRPPAPQPGATAAPVAPAAPPSAPAPVPALSPPAPQETAPAASPTSARAPTGAGDARRP